MSHLFIYERNRYSPEMLSVMTVIGHPTIEQDGRKSVIVLRNRSCLHYCALTVSVLVITAILR